MGTTRRARFGLALVGVVVLLAGCAGSDWIAAPGGGTSPDAPGRWLGGEPDWGGVESDEAAAAMERVAGTESPASADGTAPARPTVPVETRGGSLRAGSVDDNADFGGYLAYLDRLREAGVALRDLDPTGRVVVSVVGSDDHPVAGAEVVVQQGGKQLARVRTVADGTVRVLPKLYGASVGDPLQVAVGDVSATAEPGTDVTLRLDRPGVIDGPVPVDVLFLLDATGSMGDEIGRLKQSIDEVSARIDALESAPDVRFAMTLYRDDGDSFVTATYDFTTDLAAFRRALAKVEADGGGDYPEALEEGLAEALAKPSWRDPATTVQLAFLVADAPPQLQRKVVRTYPQSVADAVGRGVKVFPVASSESDDQAEGAFRQIAQATGARFVFLSYGASGAATGDRTDITPRDYEELSLDDLVVRLVSEELAHRRSGAGPTTTTAASTTTTTTNPPGQ